MLKKCKILGFFNDGSECVGIDRHTILKIGQKNPKEKIKTYIHEPDSDLDYGLVYVLYIGKLDVGLINKYLVKQEIPMES